MKELHLDVQAYLAGLTFALAASSPCSTPDLAGYPSGICCFIQGTSYYQPIVFHYLFYANFHVGFAKVPRANGCYFLISDS